MTNNLDKLEELPTKETIRKDSFSKDRTNYPINRINNWLRSRIGTPIDQVISDWVRLDWLPMEYRNYAHLAKRVQTTTYFNGEDIYFYPNTTLVLFNQNQSYLIKNQKISFFYVDPLNKTLEYHKRKKNNK